MPYANFDDRFPAHRKILRLSDAAYRVHSQAIIWCGRYTTDGYVAAADLAEVARPVRRYLAAVKELETAGLWVALPVSTNGVHVRRDSSDTAPDPAATHGPGWMIHDYLEWNKSAAWWASKQENHRTRQQRYRGRGDASRDASGDATRDAYRDAAPDQTRPDQGRGNSPRATTGPRDTPPPPRCPAHLDTPATGPCGPCGDARRALEAWQLRDADRRRTAPQCPRHRGQPAASCAPCRSERIAATVDEP